MANPTLQFRVNDDVAGGVYANMVGVWHSQHEFTLDFAATEPARKTTGPDGEEVVEIPCRVGARVKIPPTLVFDLIRAINENMTRYEAAFGDIRRPGQEEPLYPPDDQTDT